MDDISKTYNSLKVRFGLMMVIVSFSLIVAVGYTLMSINKGWASESRGFPSNLTRNCGAQLCNNVNSTKVTNNLANHSSIHGGSFTELNNTLPRGSCNPMIYSEQKKPLLKIKEIVPKYPGHKYPFIENRQATVYFTLVNNNHFRTLTGFVSYEGNIISQSRIVFAAPGQSLNSNIEIRLPDGGFSKPISLKYHDYDICGASGRSDVASTPTLIDIAALLGISLDKIHLPDEGTVAPNYDDDVFSIVYTVVPFNSGPLKCNPVSCPATEPRVITDIGSPRDVPPPGIAPILSTQSIEAIPGRTVEYEHQNLLYVILIVNAGENQAQVSRNIADAGRLALELCKNSRNCDRPEALHESMIYRTVDQSVFRGADKGGCDATALIWYWEEGLDTLDRIRKQGIDSYTLRSYQGLVNHADCLFPTALFHPYHLDPSRYDLTWTVKFRYR